jgi:hypothetical protein
MKKINMHLAGLRSSHKLLSPLVILLVVFGVMGLVPQKAFAADPGTCVVTVEQGATVSKVGKCTDYVSNPDGNGVAVDPTKCYELSQHNGTGTVTKEVACSDVTSSGLAGVPDPTNCPAGQIYGNAAGKCIENTFGCVEESGARYDEIDGCVYSASALDTPTTVTCPDGSTAVALSACPPSKNPESGPAGDTCGDPPIVTAINFGCSHKGNPILDLTFAIIRFLSIGVGFVIVGSMIWAGIQYTTSRGDPKATAEAIGRIRANVFALLLFVFAYAILNYLIPGAILK